MSFAEQFKQYVAEQPPEKPINHASWDTCAVGEFARDIDRDTSLVTSSIYDVFGCDVWLCIGNGGGAVVSMINYGELNTYMQGVTPQ